MALAATAGLLALAGYGYLALLGAAAMALLLPRPWLRYAVVLAPHFGWAVLVAAGYPLNASLPFRVVVPLLAAAALLILAVAGRRHARLLRAVLIRRSMWGEAAWPALLAAATYAAATAVHARQGTLSYVVYESDAEHFGDVIAALLSFPIGWSVAAQRGLELTPVGLGYHYVHAALSALTSIDTYTTALPSHFLLLGLAIQSVYVFARSALGLRRAAASLAIALYAVSGVPLAVASLGWGQQTAALAAVPFGIAALQLALRERDWRSLLVGGLAGALAGGALYLATAPLVAGTAAALAFTALYRVAVRGRTRGLALSQWLAPPARLLAIGGTAFAAGALSHVSTAALLWARRSGEILNESERFLRSEETRTFASPYAALGVAPLDLVRDVFTLDRQPVLTWLPPGGLPLTAAAAAAGGVLALAGLAWALRLRPAALCLLVAGVPLAVHLRWQRPFAYGEFKLLSTLWFLVPCLAAAGAVWLAAAGRHWGRARWLPMLIVAVVTLGYAIALALVQWHVVQFLSLPWQAVLPHDDVVAVKSVVDAVPRGASVLVSGQLTPQAAYQWKGPPMGHLRGFWSFSRRANYLSGRWRGIVTGMLVFSGRPVYGLVQREGRGLRAPVAPGATQYLLLDATEDPRLYGVLPSDLVAEGATLRLYRQVHRAVATAEQLAPAATSDALISLRATASEVLALGGGQAGVQLSRAPPSDLPPAVLPIEDGLPGTRTRRLARTSAERPAPIAAATGNLLVGLQAVEPVLVEIFIRDSYSLDHYRQQLLGPGLTWYTTPEVRWPADVAVRLPRPSAGSAVLPVALIAVAANPRALEESIERSDAGSVWPLLTVLARESPAQGTLALEGWYSYLGPREGPWWSVLRDSDRLWHRGLRIPTVLHPGPIGRRWRIDLRPGEAPQQWASDGRTLPSPPREWDPDPGERWLWLEFGREGEPPLHEPVLVRLIATADAAGLAEPLATSVVLPLLAETAPRPHLAEGTLVKGSGDHIFYVEHGRLRWVPSPDVLERHRILWRLTVLDDATLWRLPIGWPLS